MGSTVSVPHIATDGCQQLSFMNNHIQSLSSECRGQLKYIRLVNKSKLLKNKTIMKYIHQIDDIMKGVTLYNEEDINNSHTGSNMVLNGSVNKKSTHLIDLLTESQYCANMREELENVLLWTNNQSDDMFEIFDISDLSQFPQYTFVSHRWVSDGQPLGLHNELIAALQHVPDAYFWLDCCCIPYTQGNAQDERLRKIIWNMDSVLYRCTNMMTYYPTDGLQHTVECKTAPVSDMEHIDLKLSYGLLRLCELYSGGRPVEDLCSTVCASKELVQGCRLWCCFERVLCENKVFRKQFRVSSTSSNEFSFRRNGSIHSRFPQSPTNTAGQVMTPSMTHMKRAKMLHSRHAFSLKCSFDWDIEPISTILYDAGLLPTIFVDNFPRYRSPVNNQLEKGVLLPCQPWPSLDLKVNLRDIAHDFSVGLDGCGSTRGWYYDAKVQNFYFKCAWPQNDTIPSIQLQLHLTCLHEHSKSVWIYSDDEKFMYTFDMPNTYSSVVSPCVLCHKCSLSEC